MSHDPITAALDLGKGLVDKFFTSKDKKIEVKAKLEELAQAGDLAKLNGYIQITLAQIKVNEEQAKHKSIFVSGARPAAIWAGVFSLAWAGFIHSMLVWAWVFSGLDIADAPPLIEAGVLGSITAGLLGVAGMRSYDHKNGTSKDSL